METQISRRKCGFDMRAALIGDLRTKLRPRQRKFHCLKRLACVHVCSTFYTRSIHFSVHYPPEILTHTSACMENERASCFPVLSAWAIERACKSASLEDTIETDQWMSMNLQNQSLCVHVQVNICGMPRWRNNLFLFKWNLLKSGTSYINNIPKEQVLILL